MPKQSKLKQLREELGVSQEAILRASESLSLSAYRNAENGKRITYGTATEILNAFNSIRKDQNLSPLTLDDLQIQLF